MSEITAQDSLDIAQLTDMLNNLSLEEGKDWLSQNKDALSQNPDFVQSFLAELNKTDTYKDLYDMNAIKNLKAFEESDTATTSFGAKGMKNSNAVDSHYQRAYKQFHRALDDLNRTSMKIAIVDKRFKVVKKRFDANEEKVKLRYTEIMQSDDPSMGDIIPFVSSYKAEQAYKTSLNEDPELKASLQADKDFLKSADAQLGFKYLNEQHGATYSFTPNTNVVDNKIKEKYGLAPDEMFHFEKYKILKHRVAQSIKSLNIYEADTKKTELPDSFFESYPFSQPERSAWGGSQKDMINAYNQTKLYEAVKLEEL